MKCPSPIIEVFRSVKEMVHGDLGEVSASDSDFTKNIESWCQKIEKTLVSKGKKGKSYVDVIRKGVAPG